jgi:hypothetical protein
MLPARKSLAREVETGAKKNERGLIELVRDTICRAKILLHEEPEIRERVRRVIHVVDCLAPADLVARGVECRGDPVVDALLPVLRARPAAPCADVVRSRKNEWTKGRAVGYLLLRVLGAKRWGG